MRKWDIEITKKENGYGYTGEWDSDCFQEPTEAQDEEEAVDFARDYIRDNGGDPDEYIYRAKALPMRYFQDGEEADFMSDL